MVYVCATNLVDFAHINRPSREGATKGFVVFRHAAFAWRFLFGGDHEV